MVLVLCCVTRGFIIVVSVGEILEADLLKASGGVESIFCFFLSPHHSALGRAPP